MKQKQILYLLAINADIDLASLGDNIQVRDLVIEVLLAKNYIAVNGFGFDVTISGDRCINRLMDALNN